MKQDNRSTLDSLFQAARKAQPVFTPEEAKQVLNAHQGQAMPNDRVQTHNSPVTQSFNTAKAIIMGTAGIGAALIGTLYVLSTTPSPQQPNAQPVTIQTPQQVKPSDTPPTERATEEYTVTPHVAVTRSTPLETPATPQPVIASVPPEKADTAESFWKPVNVQKMTPVTLPAAAMPQTGIKLEKNGNITFYFQEEGSEQPTKISLPKKNGIVLEPTSELTPQELKEIKIPTTGPVLITTTNGQKRLFRFSSRNTMNPAFAKMFGMDSTGMKMSQHTLVLNGEDAGEHSVVIQSESHDSLPNGGREMLFQVQKLNQRDVKGFGFDSTVKFKINFDTTVLQSLSKLIDTNGLKALAHLKGLKNLKQLDKLPDLSKLNGLVKMGDFDSVMRVFRVEGNDSLPAVFRNKQMMRIEINNEVNDAMNGFDPASIQPAIDSAMNIVNKLDVSSLVSNTLNSIHLNEVDPDHLVPILVRNDLDPKNVNELIFWYEPTDSITQLPGVNANNQLAVEKTNSTNSSNVLSDLSIYPNPAARDHINVRYQVAETRNVHFALHNLLGQRVADLNTIHSPAGFNADKLSLSNLEPGVYLLVATTDHGEQMVQRLVIGH